LTILKRILFILSFIASACFVSAQTDSIPERKSGFVPADSVSFAPALPENDAVKTTVEYDSRNGYYIIHTKMGDVDIATPYMMTESEYRLYSEQQAMGRYWEQKISEVEHSNEKKFDITDMKFNIGPADKVFGPGGIQIKLQGSAELLFGFKHQYVGNPALTKRTRNNNALDFDEKIQVSVNASVGDKLSFNMNYNTEASFDFDQQLLKLKYKGKEDDIIQSLEAGNVSLNLNSSLIRGSQSLFGIKADLKFGRLSVQALISQQNSQSQSVNSEGGAQTTKFEVSTLNYDENRHFFLSYYFRENYENAMRQLPYIASGITINRIEVWITNKRGNYDNSRNLVAFVDLGEAAEAHLLANGVHSITTSPLPNNKANSLYGEIASMADVRNIQQTNAILGGLHPDWTGGEDYEKIESARLLNASEYTLNSALGYISLRQALNQDEVLCVAYEYSYGGQVYQVGEFSTENSENLKAPNALFVKMLKSSSNAPIPEKPHRGTWDLMMKNIYSIGATQMSSENFELQVMYRNDSVGTDLQYLPETKLKGKPLLRVMNLDRLDKKNNKTPDGKFDYIEGYTALSSMGRIIFPVLEPFGSYLASQIDDPLLAEKYIFQELYDSTLVNAEEYSEKNKFTLTGKYKGTNGSEIRLNAMNVPRGSVTVTAGGATLIENVDYTVDYMMGVVKILNQSLIDAGTNINVKLENQSTFSMQRKSLIGTHLEYQFNKDFSIGGTLMYMNERPLTTKVNTGSEPLSNLVWGLNLAYKTEFMWLTNGINAIPWINATQPSTFQINAEFAHLVPGHTREVGKQGLAYIDDFEATKTNIDLHYSTFWHLSSTPSRFPEYDKSGKIEYGFNRALMSWFMVDPIFGHPQSNTPQHIRDDVDALSDHRTRIVYEQELYPNKEQLATEDTRQPVLNISYYPSERGPYNLNTDDIQPNGLLNNPQRRWGGMMRKIDNTDFEVANIEYIEFWMMDPFLTNSDPSYEGGTIYIDLGDVSEDILKDGKKSFEHGLPVSDNDLQNLVDTTVWGLVPRTTSTTVAFANEAGARQRQDVGLDGLNDAAEQQFVTYSTYLQELRQRVDATTISRWNSDPFSPLNDPAGDNYHYYRGTDYDNDEVSVLDRYKHFVGVEGNSPDTDNSPESYGTASTLTPDIEDVNSDNTLSEYEKYYEYRIDIKRNMMQVGLQHITERMECRVKLENGTTETVTWYQFKIPIRDYTQKVGSIRNFKSIRFMRLYLTDFKQETFLRFGTLDLVRGEWRSYNKDLMPVGMTAATNGSLDVQAVNIEENNNRTPVNYVLPPGITRQTDPGQAQLIAQNEQAMVLRVHNLSPADGRAVYKNTSYDMRQYKRFQMFVHAEKLQEDESLRDGDLHAFVRLGSDLKNNYYEYDIPLSLTPEGIYNNENEADRRLVWPENNMFDFPFEVLTDAKLARNAARRSGTDNVGNAVPYTIYDDDSGKPQNKITVLGNPTLGEVTSIMVGIRNGGSEVHSGEVWVNEMRMSDYKEDGGVAAMANVALGISDIAQVNVAGQLETAGYGSIESSLLQRNMDNKYQISVSAAVEAGRLFPEKAKLQIPFYVSYSNETTSPEYDPLDTDVKLKDNLDTYDNKHDRDSIRNRAITVHKSTNISISSAKVNIHSKKKNMFYDPANFTISYAHSVQDERTPEVELDRTKEDKGSFTYAYSFNPKPWEPFAKIEKVKKLKWISELNIYYLPQSWSFSTDMSRTFTHMKTRDFNQDTEPLIGPTVPENHSFSKDWMWNRNFDFKYDLTKNLKFSFQTAMNSTVEEGYYTPEIIKDYAFTHDYYEAWKDTVLRSLKTMGTPYQYQQVFTASFNVPFNRFVSLDWINANVSYNATYNWNRTTRASDEDSNLGNTISSMASWQGDATLNFENLYNKSKYLKDINQRYNGRPSRRPSGNRQKNFSHTINDAKADSTYEVTHRLGAAGVNITATDANGKKVKIKYKVIDNNKVSITPTQDVATLSLAMTPKAQADRTPGQVVGDLSLRFLMMVRKVQVTYRHTNSLVVPGFGPQAGFMGQQRIDGKYAPGFDFAFGFFNSDKFMDKARKRYWLSADTTVVQPATSATTSDLDIKIQLEPFPGFKIQVSGKYYNAKSKSLIYSYEDMQETMTGSYNITTVAIGTAFDRISSAATNFHSDAFDRFLENRDKLQNRVTTQYQNVQYPNSGFIKGTPMAGRYFRDYNQKVDRNSADVLIPAFLSAYLGRSPSKIGLNPFLGMKNILPNWSVTFDGLGRLPWLRDHFRSITLTHAYTCKYSIGAYTSYSTWVGVEAGNRNLGFIRDVETELPLPSSAFDIASVQLQESFSPLIGLNIAMKNSVSLKAEYRQQRNLALNITSVQLMEGNTKELVVGVGYTIKNFDVIIKAKNDRQNKVRNDLKLTLDFSYKNVKSLLRKIEEDITQASSGNKVFSVKFSADYTLSSKVNLQFFYEHQGTTPLLSTSFPVKSDNVGINVKLMLTR